jgi:Putative transmembrane protein (PGPGW)
MFDSQSWDRFVHTSPGRRFQERYRRKSASDRGRIARCAVMLAGIGLTLVGVFFLAVPGPGIPILAIGLALVAQESALMARFLDRAEVRLRRWWKRVRS